MAAGENAAVEEGSRADCKLDFHLLTHASVGFFVH